MRIRFGLVAFQTPVASTNLPYAGSVINGAIIPDDWTGIKADPRFTITGDGINPVNAQSVLSFQPNGQLQARNAGTAGAWEVVSFGGGFFSVETSESPIPPTGTLCGPFPYVQVS